MTRLLLSALLALFPHTPARRCIEQRFDQIAQLAHEASQTHGVPAQLLIAVGFEESWLACHPGESSWGAPASRTRRHIAGTPFHAASALALGYRRCRSWQGALHHFRCGLCACGTLNGYTPRQALRLAERLRLRAGLP